MSKFKLSSVYNTTLSRAPCSINYLYLICAICGNVFFIQNSYPQTSTNSPYSAIGIGEIESKAFAPATGMGDTKFAVASPFAINISNPASYSFLAQPVFEAGLASKQNNITGSDGSAGQFSSTYFRNMAFAVPISKRWGACFGIVPFSKIGYKTTLRDTVSNFGKVTYSYEGMGGIHQFFMGHSVSFIKDSVQLFSAGIQASYLFGEQQRLRRVVPDPSLNASGFSTWERTNVSDFYFDFGLLYQRKIGTKAKTTLAVTYSAADSIRLSYNMLAESFTGLPGQETVNDTIALPPDSSVNGLFIPQRLGAGVAFQWNNQWTFALDYSMQEWLKFYYLGRITDFQNSWQVSAGVQYINDERETREFLKMVNYRAGVRYAKTHLTYQGVQLNEYGISFGLGLPMADKSKTSFNIGAELGTRRAESTTKVKEEFINFVFGFTFTPVSFDRWFAKPKIE